MSLYLHPEDSLLHSCRVGLQTTNSLKFHLSGFFFNWSVVELQFCVRIRCTAKYFSCLFIYMCLYICIFIFQIILPYRLLQNIEHSSICYKLFWFLVDFEILLIIYGIQWVILLLSNSLGMPHHSLRVSIIFAKKFALNVVNNLFVVSSFSPCDFRVLSLSFDSLIIVCLNVVFILLGVHYISCLCKIISSIKFGKFSVIVSLYTLSLSPFPLGLLLCICQ